jgi:hypothetical protein
MGPGNPPTRVPGAEDVGGEESFNSASKPEKLPEPEKTERPF